MLLSVIGCGARNCVADHYQRFPNSAERCFALPTIRVRVSTRPDTSAKMPQHHALEAVYSLIDVYYWPTPNGWKVTVMLEECDLDYQLLRVDIGAGDQFKPDFLRISPNNRMPAMVDLEPHDADSPIELFESGAILEYLADKTGQLLAPSGRERYRVLQ